MNYRELISGGSKRLEDSQIPNASLDSFYIFEYLTGIHKSELLLVYENAADQALVEKFFECIEKRCQHIPLQHITGSQEFMGLLFHVNEDVLVPRQDTEILVERTLKELEKLQKAGKKDQNPIDLLDVCTGSGCIIISLAKLGKNLHCSGVDISDKALLIAEENAGKNGVEVSFLQSDLFSNVTQKFDVIVSNPPYIKSDAIPGLMPEVRDHDPRIALDGGKDGLEFYRKIASGAPAYLKDGGRLHFEIGVDEASAVTEIMKDNGFMDIKVYKDYSDNDRVVMGHL